MVTLQIDAEKKNQLTLMRQFAIWLLATQLVGCANPPCRFRIAGTLVPNNTEGSSAEVGRLPEIIGDAVKPFGFSVGAREFEDMFTYALGGRTYISDERINVVWDVRAQQIYIIDYNHNVETTLVEKLIASITKEIEANGVFEVSFKTHKHRWTDCLGP